MSVGVVRAVDVLGIAPLGAVDVAPTQIVYPEFARQDPFATQAKEAIFHRGGVFGPISGFLALQEAVKP